MISLETEKCESIMVKFCIRAVSDLYACVTRKIFFHKETSHFRLMALRTKYNIPVGKLNFAVVFVTPNKIWWHHEWQLKRVLNRCTDDSLDSIIWRPMWRTANQQMCALERTSHELDDSMRPAWWKALQFMDILTMWWPSDITQF